MTAKTDLDQALASCSEEPIHLCGKIQSHGVLLAFDKAYKIRFCSSNTLRHIGVSVNKLIGTGLQQFLRKEGLQDVVRFMAAGQVGPRFPFFVTINSFVGTPLLFECFIQKVPSDSAEELTILELCLKKESAKNFDWARIDFSKVQSQEDFFHTVPEHLRELSDFDRVMLYKFQDDGSGVVVGEAKRSDMSSFLGHCFPASDIPSQARALYLQNLVRGISDVDDVSADVLAGPIQGANPTIDLTNSCLRSVSPVHIEYLKNMTVQASFSISLVVDGRLWGLLACHHARPKDISFELYSGATFLSDVYSSLLKLLIEKEKSELVQGVLRDTLELGRRVPQDLSAWAELIEKTLRANAVLILTSKTVSFYQAQKQCQVPDAFMDRHQELWSFIRDKKSLVERSIEQIFPRLLLDRRHFAGAIARMGVKEELAVIAIRPEVIQTQFWAGNPQAAKAVSFSGGRIEPRKSFESFRQDTSGLCVPWLDIEVECFEIIVNELESRQSQISAQQPALNQPATVIAEAAIEAPILSKKAGAKKTTIKTSVKKTMSAKRTSDKRAPSAKAQSAKKQSAKTQSAKTPVKNVLPKKKMR